MSNPTIKEIKERNEAALAGRGLSSPYDTKHLLEELARVNRRLEVAANQLEGVSLAIRQHGTNIDPAFFIDTYERFAKDAREAISTKSGE